MCPGGGDHATVGSLSYFNLLAIPPVPTAPAYQRGWRRCRKCQGSCYGGLLGVCTGGGPHDFQDSAWYAMPTAALTEVSTQEGWRWCSKCQILFHPGLGAGLCPAGGGHDATGSGTYFLASSSYSTDGQEGWRYCSKCHAMHLTSAGSGLCPGGGTHTDTGSIKYSMLLGAPSLLPEQSGWCRCRKCQGVCYVGLPGTCAAGGTHDFQGSARYVMHRAAPTEVYGQAGWRWCKKCQVLFHPGIGAGLCPSGGGHDSTGSGAYFTACAPYPAGGQEGWRYCTNCHVLHLPGTAAGVCPAGGVHLVTGSGTYSLKLEQPIETQCKLIVDYDENQEPHSCFEVVLIPHTTDGSLLPGSQVKVLSTTPVNIIHQDKGVFTYQGLDSSTPLLLTTSAMGRARFIIVAPPDKMAIPNLFAQSVAMNPGQWVEFSPDDDLHTKLAGLTANQLVTAPAGKPGPLLPSSRLADAQALAGGVSLLMGRFKPQASAVAASEGALSFWNPFDGDDWKDLGNDIADAAGTVGGAIASAAQRTADVATSVANTIASQTTYVVGSVAQVLDTVGAAAQILIKHADLATAHLVGDFVSTAMATATQLAIDVADKVTVLALVVVNGVQSIVKTVVENIEAAVQIVGAFFVRVGLTIKAVIDFLASLFDWDAILRIQSQLQDAVDERLNSIGNTIATQRASLSTQFQTLEATIAGLGEGSQVPSAQSSSGHSSSIGGQFGYLMDRLQSALGGGLSLPIDFGLDGVAAFLTSLTGTVASEVESFLVSFASSPLCAAFADPKQLLGLGADALLALVKPLAGGAIRIVKAIADGALAVVPTLVSGLKSVIQQRISIPLLTDFIELVVFHRKQKLCLESLFTLVTAAFIHVTRKLFGSGGPLSFADDSQGSVDPLAALATVLSLVQAMLTGASVAIESESKVKLLGAVGSFLGFFGCAVTPPYSVSSASFVLPEQWLNWIFNLVASTLQLIDGVRQINGSDSMKVLGVGSATCGFLMIVFAIGFDSAAIKNGRGDAQLARLDMGAQIVSGINNTNPLLPEEAQPFLSVAGNLAAFGIGIESMKYSVAHPDASLG